MITKTFGDFRGALFSYDMKYRYALWDLWAPRRKVATFILLNPSTADEIKNDPTVERCSRRAKAMGYGGVRIANIFALRSTDPKVLRRSEDPVGYQNNWEIINSCVGAGIVICGWGAHGGLLRRSAAVRTVLRERGITCYCLGLTAGGEPRHPLYVGYNVKPMEFKP